MNELIIYLFQLPDRKYWLGIVLCLTILCVAKSNAQTADSTVPDSSSIETRAMAEESPYDYNAAMGMRYGDISNMAKSINASTDKYTGVVNVDVPIYVIQTNNKDLPISLSYKTSGIRVDDIASEVGLGWELSAGGRITRYVRGQADKKEDLLYADEHAEMDGQDYYDKCMTEELDTQPDIYYFSYPGGGGTFAFDLEWKPRAIPFQNIIIKFENNVFTIFDSQGTKYTFGTNEKRKEFSKEWISSWHLDRIEYLDGTTVIYEYNAGSNYDVWSKNNVTDFFVTHPSQPNCNLILTNTYYSKFSILEPKYLSSIRCKEQEVRFTYDTNREDLNGLKRLTSIDVYASDVKYRSFKLNYTAFPDKTPKLISIREQPQTGIIKPMCSFEYYEDIHFPQRDRGYYGFDHWGFFNTNIEEPIVYPDLRLVVPNYPENSYVKGASREPNLLFTRSQSLKKITFPNGGTKEFVYDLHYGLNLKTNQYENAGGLRIKEVVERTSNSARPSITRYKYFDGIIYDDAFNYIAQYGEMTGVDRYRVKVSTKCISMPVDFHGASVVYSAVVEYFPNGSSIRYGYVPMKDFPDLEPEFIFLKKNPFRYIDCKGRSAKTSRAWGRNILKNKVWYSDNQMVMKETYNYQIDTVRAIKIPSRHLYSDGSYYDQFSNYPSTSYCFYDKSYLISCPVVLTKKVVAKSQTTLPSHTSYLYNENFVPTTVIETDCENNRTTTVIQYPDTSSANQSLRKLTKRNAILPIEKITYRNGKVVDAELNSYKLNPLNPNYLVPDASRSYKYQQSIDSTNFRPSNLLAEHIEYDQTKYRTALIYDEHDDLGNLLCYHEPNGIFHSIIYDANQNAPIAYVENARYSVRTDGRVTQVFFNNFELNGIDHAKAKSGYRVGNKLMSYVIDLSYFMTGSYILSYWYKTDENSKWLQYKQDVTVTSQSTMYYVPMVPGMLYIDDMSLLPKNAVMTSQCSVTPRGKISETDAQGRTTYYEYNKAGLPSRVYDNDRTLIQQYSYDNYGVDL